MIDSVVLGVDAGPSSCGYAILRSPERPGHRPVFVTGGSVPSDPDNLWGLIESQRLSVPNLAVAVEGVRGYAYGIERSAHLVATNGVAEFIHGIVYANRIPYVGTSAATWRKALCGKANASDATIKRVVVMLIEGVPRTNAHVRDACGAAFYAMNVLQARAATVGYSKASDWAPTAA